jgi:sugar/nucleoside kinase (ribokinase family)
MIYMDEFPEPAPRTVFASGYHDTVGSSGAGKALNMRSLGAESTLWALLGDDEYGAKVRNHLAGRGVELLTGLDPLGTMRHVNLMNAAGERISVFLHGGSRDIELDIEPVMAVMRDADIVSVTIMNYCRQFLAPLRDLGKPVAIDIHDYDGANPYHHEFIEAADYLFMSSLLLDDWRSFLEARVAAGTSVAVCTHGSAGASGLTAATGWVDVAAAPVERIVDTNGAGDAFYAGFMMAWLGGGGLTASMRGGAEHAALAVQSPELAPR